MPLAKPMLATGIAYTAWATRLLLTAASALTQEELTRDLGLSHRSVLATLWHIYLSERFWTDCLRQDAMPPMDEIGNDTDPPAPSLADLEQLWTAVWLDMDRWLASLHDEDLAREIPCRISAGRQAAFTRWQLVLHSINHATLHRGQIASMLRMLGKQPPNTDLMGLYLSH